MQVAHTTSAVADPAVATPSPTAHVLQATHELLAVSDHEPVEHAKHVLLPAAENVPAAHTWQEALAACAAHPALHWVHVPAPCAAAKPAAQGVVAALPSQEWPAGHAAHTRFDDWLGARVSYSVDASHASTSWHTRSLVPVGAANVY